MPRLVTAVAAYADNCNDELRELDLTFYVFTSDVSAPASFSWESAQTLRRDPATAAGVGPRGPHFTLEPSASFNESDKFASGAQVTFMHPSGFRLRGEGEASSRYTNVALSASGSHDVELPAVWRVAYGGGYRFREEPIDGDALEQRYAFGWFFAATRPLPSLDAPVRYAVQLEGGSQDSQLSSPGFASDTRYAAAKLLAGISGGKGPHDYSLNLGYQLGVDGSVAAAWHKVVVDGVYSVRAVPSMPFFDPARSISKPASRGAGSDPWPAAAPLRTNASSGASVRADFPRSRVGTS